ncbi:MAG: hypothetical protein IJ220_00370 [Clostridia bacterium]|nr:hypothetical protein [Clostridia bacterium]
MERNDRYQLLRKPSVDLFAIQRNEKGAARISNFTKIYLRAKLISNAKEEIDSMLVKIPSNENTLNSP